MPAAAFPSQRSKELDPTNRHWQAAVAVPYRTCIGRLLWPCLIAKEADPHASVMSEDMCTAASRYEADEWRLERAQERTRECPAAVREFVPIPSP